jgi:hypothetical protein
MATKSATYFVPLGAVIRLISVHIKEVHTLCIEVRHITYGREIRCA